MSRMSVGRLLPVPETQPRRPAAEKPDHNLVTDDQLGRTNMVLVCNLDYRTTRDDIRRFCDHFGEAITYPIMSSGTALCTFFDVRCSYRCVAEGTGVEILGHPITVSFSPNQKNDFCSVVVKSEKELRAADIQGTMSAFGEVRAVEQHKPTEFLVRYFDLRSAASCIDSQKALINGVQVTMEQPVDESRKANKDRRERDIWPPPAYPPCPLYPPAYPPYPPRNRE